MGEETQVLYSITCCNIAVGGILKVLVFGMLKRGSTISFGKIDQKSKKKRFKKSKGVREWARYRGVYASKMCHNFGGRYLHLPTA